MKYRPKSFVPPLVLKPGKLYVLNEPRVMRCNTNWGHEIDTWRGNEEISFIRAFLPVAEDEDIALFVFRKVIQPSTVDSRYDMASYKFLIREQLYQVVCVDDVCHDFEHCWKEVGSQSAI